MTKDMGRRYGHGLQRTYPGEAQEAAFPLGGIGTGNISLGSRGEWRDWEIFNRPGKGFQLPNAHFAIWARRQGEAPVAKVLESKLIPPYKISHGYYPITAAGLPRLDSCLMYGEYPIARFDFTDRALPVEVSLEAYTPLIPLEPEDSGIPCAILTYRVANTSDKTVDVTIAGSLVNPVGGIGFDKMGSMVTAETGFNVNEFRNGDGFAGLYFHSEKYRKEELPYGNLALVTTNRDLTCKRAWLRGSWFDNLQEFWDDFSDDGRLNDLGYDPLTADGQTDTGSLGVRETLAPGESKLIRFVLAWYFPNRINGWSETLRVTEPGRETVRNHYANRFDSAWDVAGYVIREFNRLDRGTRAFRDALFDSTLPAEVLDAVSGNMPVLRSNTCFWLEDGHFLGYEGCFDDWGCCEGSCTHVWNYAQTLAFLFPSLERSMRRTEYLEEVEDNGKMNFRIMRIFETEWLWHNKTAPAAADGQLGSVMRVFRDWKLSGDGDFLRELWPNVKKTLKYALLHWDTDGDGVLDGEQHNTYDIEFFGPNPLTGILLLGALRAGEEIARYLQETNTADLYRSAFERSAARLEELTWNGEYYEQRLDDINAHKYQFGTGCLSDQLLGQQMAYLFGLGSLLPREHIRKAIRSVYAYNFRDDFANHANCQRTFVLNGEQGLLLCSWPRGGRPRLPFVYSDEVWTGIEYQVATNLIYEGFVEEALALVKAVRDRQNGFKRNPWNEVECGHHYARSMSSWGLLIALSGFECDLARNVIRFAPAIDTDDFACFWSTGKAWGTYRQYRRSDGNEPEVEVTVLYGDAAGLTVQACGKEWTPVQARSID